jgi:hypothetical protein
LGRRKTAKGSREELDKDFTVHEAQHILASEGGELTRTDLIVEAIWALAFSVALAWVVIAGEATAWHLLVPLFAEYLTCLVALPLIQVGLRHSELRQTACECIRAILIVAFIGAGAIWGQSLYRDTSFAQQWHSNLTLVLDWMAGRHLIWPILIASAHGLRNLARNVVFVLNHGPPFLGPGMGWGFRIAILVLASVLAPTCGFIVVSVLQDLNVIDKGLNKGFTQWNGIVLTWIVWACLLIADLTYLWFRWDTQTRLKQKGFEIGRGIAKMH